MYIHGFFFHQVPVGNTVCACVYLHNDIISSVVVNCGLFPNLTNGTMSYSAQGLDQTLVGATVTYTCNTGYRLNGSMMHTCQADGTWSGSDPTCDSECRVQGRIVRVQTSSWVDTYLYRRLGRYSWRAGSQTVTASLSVSSSAFVAYCTKAVEEIGSEAITDCGDRY